MYKKQHKDLHTSVRGQAMVEFIIVFFPLFMLILLVIQTTLILTARQIVQYAAFNSARTVIVHIQNSDDYEDRALQAAAISCIPISPKFSAGAIPIVGDTISSALSSLPGNMGAYITKYLFSRYALTSVNIHAADNSSGAITSGSDVTVDVTHNYVLRIPLINKLFFKLYWVNKVRSRLQLSNFDFLDLAAIDTAVESVAELIKFPSYWIPITASCTLTVGQPLPSGY